MRKQISKRRVIARFNLGRPIPWLLVEKHRLKSRLVPAIHLPNLDAIRKATGA